ncbi:MAG: hypothetical protein LBC97_05245 [Bifidobacteriaceae bacterium]|jgi:hypothetical protein|nr:hypothetical protein [Bifidobacteriaceae bacterium]
MSDGKKQGGGISVIQVLASALAAVTSTVALSYLGVAGTILGAALAAVITVVGNFIYTRSLDRTHKAVKNLAQQAVTAVLPAAHGSGQASAVSAAGEAADGSTQTDNPDDAAEPVPNETAAPEPVAQDAAKTKGEDGAEGTASAESGADGQAEAAGESQANADSDTDSDTDSQTDAQTDSDSDGSAGKGPGLAKLDNASWLRELIRRHGPVKALAGLGLAVFLVIMAIVTGVELLLGNTISDELTGRDSGRKTTFVNPRGPERTPSAPPSEEARESTPPSESPSPAETADPSPSELASQEPSPSGDASPEIDPSGSAEPASDPAATENAEGPSTSPSPGDQENLEDEALPKQPSPK